MYRNTQAFIDRLEGKGLFYKVLGQTESGDEVIFIPSSAGKTNGPDLSLYIAFAASGGSVSLRIPRLLQTAEEKPLDALIAMQDCNSRYRFAKFCLSDDDNRFVRMEMDVLLLPDLRPDHNAELCAEAMHLMLRICKEVYPELQQLLT